MKMFALTAAAVAGLLCTATSADAQFRGRGGNNVYVAPSYGYSSGPVYGYPSYSGYSTYSSSAYTGPVGVGTYTPLGGTTFVAPSSYSSSAYTPVYDSSVVMPATYSSSAFSPTFVSPSSYTPVYSSPVYGSSFSSPIYGSSYTYPAYSGYNSGIYLSPSGGSMRGWRR